MRAISLFSGCGGLDLAAEAAGIEIVAQCEIDKDCRAVLKRHWPEMTIWEDIRDVTGNRVREQCGAVDLVFGGPPCQPVSVAGRRKAAGDERNMWPQYLRLLRELRPRWAVAENPTGILSAPRMPGEPKGTFFGDILREMDTLGYVVGWGVWGACDVGNDEGGTSLPVESAGCAPHQRERVFLVAYNQGIGRGARRAEPERFERASRFTERGIMANPAGERLNGIMQPRRRWAGFANGGDVGDTRRTGREERDVTAFTGVQGYPAGECTGGHVGHSIGGAMRDDIEHGRQGTGENIALGAASGNVCDTEQSGLEGQHWWRSGTEPANGYAHDDGRAQPRLGRNADGSACGLHLPDRWPAGRGAEQFTWEPPRTVPSGSVKGRGARLKMLGNMVVPQQAWLLFEEIVRAEADI